MSVINITPDSFSDGGDFFAPERALERAKNVIEEGAHIIDLGAQSTRPGASIIGYEEEKIRLLPALSLIRKELPEAIISIDTFDSRIAKLALDEGANLINDVTGGQYDPNIFKVSAEANCPFVITHSRGNSQNMDELTCYEDVTKDVKEWLLIQTQKAISAGLSEDKIIWDPGLGFAKTNQQCLTILKELELLTVEKFPVLVGPSRKRFIGHVLAQNDPLKRIWGTAAVACRCYQANVSYIRVHDVNPINEVVKMSSFLW